MKRIFLTITMDFILFISGLLLGILLPFDLAGDVQNNNNETEIESEYMSSRDFERYYRLNKSVYISTYDQEVMRFTLETRAKLFADNAEVLIESENGDGLSPYLIKIRLIYYYELNIPHSAEHVDEIFHIITSPGEIKGIINYNEQGEEIVFSNIDLEMVECSSGDNGFEVSFVYKGAFKQKELMDKLITLVLDDKIMTQQIIKNNNSKQSSFEFQLDSNNSMYMLWALAKTLPLKYGINEVLR